MPIKKIYLAFLVPLGLTVLTTPIESSAKRLVLLEEFTNTGCGPCAAYAPYLDELINDRLGDVVVIKNHGNYPDARDQWYLGDQEAIDARIAAYEISGYPTTILDGVETNRAIENLNAKIDERIALPEVVKLTSVAAVDGSILKVEIEAEALEALTASDLRLHVAVIEEEYISPVAFKNGETEFHNTAIKYLTGAEGYALGSFAAAGDKASYSTEWEIAGFNDTNQLAVVAFVQDMATKEVISTVYSPRAPETADGAKIVQLIGAPTKICTPHYSVNVRFRNTGANLLTTCNVCVEINGTVQKTPWSGNLEYLETTYFQTPDFTDFALADEEENEVKVYISDINGSDATSVALTPILEGAARCENSVQLTVFTDNKPEETSYTVYNSNDEAVYESEPFTEKRKFYKTILPLPGEDCYRVEFTDLGEDGIAGESGNGYYSLHQVNTEGKTKLVLQDTFYGGTATCNFELRNAASVEMLETAGTSDWSVTGTSLTAHKPGHLVLTDLSGRVVLSRALAAGESVDLTTAGADLFLLSFTTANSASNAKILVR